MAVRDDFSAGEVLAAADLNDTFASKLPYSYGTATPSTSVNGFLWYDENNTPPTPKFWDGAAFQALGGAGKIVQIVRATDSTQRTTTSTSYVDVSGMSVTITPTASNSAIIILATGTWTSTKPSDNASYGGLSITDSSNNTISGAQSTEMGLSGITGSGNRESRGGFSVFAYATPATTSAVTYKLRFKSFDAAATFRLENNASTGQMFAIEVAA